MAHIKNVRIPFSVDIGVDDVIVPGAVKRTVATRLEGFEEPNIYTYSLESTMAEKFDAILKRMTASSRMKDFYDIYYWSQVFDFEGRVLQEAISETLQHRGTPYEKDSMEQIRAFDQNEFLQNCGIITIPDQGLKSLIFLLYWFRLTGLLALYMEHYCEKMNFGMWSSKENVWK